MIVREFILVVALGHKEWETRIKFRERSIWSRGIYAL